MRKPLVVALAVFLPGLCPAAVMTAEQHGAFKRTYRVTIDGSGGTLQRLPISETSPAMPIAPMPDAGLDGVRLVASGDQHLAVTGADGRALCYYHLPTDTWAVASEMKPPRTFGCLAWSVVVLYFLIVAGMALHFVRKKKDTESFFRGGGRIPWYVAGMSIFATMISSVTFLAAPTQFYLCDWSYILLVAGMPLTVPLVVMFYLPLFRRLHLTSAYEYLERRFNGLVRMFASAVYFVFIVARVAVVTLLPALALHSVTAIPIDLCIAVCGAVTIAYCALGGLEAVVWSDFVQGCVLVLGACAILTSLWFGTAEGPVAAVSNAVRQGKFDILDLRLVTTEPVAWVLVVLGFCETFGTMTSDQCIIQRYGAVTDERAAARSMWFNCVMSVGISIIFAVIGTGLWVFYRSHPTFLDPALPKADSILPCYIANEMHPALAGLVVAAVFAATISTLSANLAGASAALTSDFALRFRPDLSPKAQIRCGQAFTAVTGLLGMAAALGLAHADTRTLFDTFKEAVTMLSSGLAGLFFIGVFLRRVRGRAAVAGLAAGYAVCFALRYADLPFVRPHVFLIGAIGFTTCVLTAFLASFVLPERARDLSGLTVGSLR